MTTTTSGLIRDSSIRTRNSSGGGGVQRRQRRRQQRQHDTCTEIRSQQVDDDISRRQRSVLKVDKNQHSEVEKRSTHAHTRAHTRWKFNVRRKNRSNEAQILSRDLFRCCRNTDVKSTVHGTVAWRLARSNSEELRTDNWYFEGDGNAHGKQRCRLR